MKNLFCFFLMLMMIYTATFAQVAVNMDGTAPDSSSMLDVKSTAKGFLAPRMTFTEMNSIIRPASGLMVFCTTTGQYYFNNGTPAAPNWVGSFILPFSGSFSSYSTLLDLTNTGFGYVGTFIINNPASYASALYAETNGPGWTITSYNNGTTDGFAGYFRNTSPTNNWPAIQGKTAGTGPVFRAYQTLGPGGGLDVHMRYATSTAAGIVVYQEALGNACQFFLNNAASTASALHAENNGSGDVGFFQTNSPTGSNAAVKGRAINTGGGAGAFEIYNTNNPNAVLSAFTQGTGSSGTFTIDNSSSNANALYAGTNGSGVALFASSSGTGHAIHGINTGTANTTAAFFNNTSPTNNWPAVQGYTAGTGPVFRAIQDIGPGPGMDVIMLYPSSTAQGIGVDHFGLGSAAIFKVNNTSNYNAAIYTETYGAGSGINITHYGLGSSGYFKVNNASNFNAAIYTETNGTGSGIQVAHNGLGSAGNFTINNASNSNSAIYSETNGSGSAIYGKNTGSANTIAGFFQNTNPANNYPAIQGSTAGTGPIFRANQETGPGPGIEVNIINTSNTSTALDVAHNGLGPAGNFFIYNSSNGNSAVHAETHSNTGTALYAKTTGNGTAFISTHNGSSGNIAIFQSSLVSKARIDKTGKGFFNGGTQTGGADVAELFDVEGPVVNYEPGDVMVISESSDRTMEKSSEPVSTRVAGVYATKPGVTLTEKDIEDNLDQLVPVGVIGVIPTKVCDENGPIKRGDLLVTSSKPGHAMKAIAVKINGMLIYPTGAILGKALENFEKGGQGLIKVLVNVK